jgi:aminopeptidase N
MVLHMLRRLVGDDAFFAGIRAFYAEWKFRKAGTDDFQRAMEKAAGRDLTRFFAAWIFGSDIPHVKFSYHVSDSQAIVRFEQRADPVDVPITVTVTYASGITESVLVVLAEKHTERTLGLKGPVRRITANADSAALAIIDK